MSSALHLQLALLDKLDQQLPLLGLRRRNRKSLSYFTPTPLGPGSFHLMFVRLRSVPAWEVGVDINVRVEAVERLINPDRTEGATIGIDIGTLVSRSVKRWDLQSADDVSRVADEMCKAAEDVAFPFFGRFETLESVAAAVRDEPIGWILSPVPAHRALTLVAIARLQGADPAPTIGDQRSRLLVKNPANVRLFDEGLRQLLERPLSEARPDR